MVFAVSYKPTIESVDYMTIKEKIVEKVKKLLALAGNNPNEQEAQLALLKAQKLMSEYKIEVNETENKREIICLAAEHKWDYKYRYELAKVLAQNFCCELVNVRMPSDSKGKRQCVIHFVGYKEDAEVCVQLFNYTYQYIMKRGNHVYNQAYAFGKETAGIFNGFAYGFIAGIKGVLDSQCRALKLVVPEEVTQKSEDLSNGTQSIKVSVDKTIEAFAQGEQEGREFIENRHQRLAS